MGDDVLVSDHYEVFEMFETASQAEWNGMEWNA
jgi:hypothetical protein